MYKQGFIKIGLASPKTASGDVKGNVKEIIKVLEIYAKEGVEIAIFPKLCLTGACCGDLYLTSTLWDANIDAIKELLAYTGFAGTVVVGSYVIYNHTFYPASFVISKQKILGIVPYAHDLEPCKYNLSPNLRDIPFGEMMFTDKHDECRFLCVDESDLYQADINHDADFIVCSGIDVAEVDDRQTEVLVLSAAIRRRCAYLFTSVHPYDSTSECLYSGQMIAVLGASILYQDKEITTNTKYGIIDLDLKRIRNLKKQAPFPQKKKIIDKQEFPLNESPYRFTSFSFHPFALSEDEIKRIIKYQAMSVWVRLNKIKHKRVVFGLSGGLDSTLALLSLCYMTDLHNMPRLSVYAYIMPSENTKDTSLNVARSLAKEMKVTTKLISIDQAVKMQLKYLNLENDKGIVYENAQARYRTYCLMNAANAVKGIVIGTGDASEIALGWMTFNGDQMAMYNINAGIPKTALKQIVAYYKKVYPEIASLLSTVLAARISPELASKDQDTEEVIGKYELNDFILYRFLACRDMPERITYLLSQGYNLSYDKAKETVDNFMHRFYQSQFKRQSMAEGIRIFSFGVAGRSGFIMPGDIINPDS